MQKSELFAYLQLHNSACIQAGDIVRVKGHILERQVRLRKVWSMAVWGHEPQGVCQGWTKRHGGLPEASPPLDYAFHMDDPRFNLWAIQIGKGNALNTNCHFSARHG